MPGQDKIRVLIVDDIAETRDNIVRMLQFDNNIEVIGTAQSGKEAIRSSSQLKPDVVLMDINMPDMDGIAATEAVRRNAPYIQVVILSVQSDPSYMRRAMLAGARDFLTKPPMIDELTTAIRHAGVVAHDEKMKLSQTFPATTTGNGQVIMPSAGDHGKIIVVYSPKGGTGTTTVATNLAIALKADDNKVLLVDASMQFGDILVFLNEQVKNTALDLTPRVEELDTEVVENVLTTHAATGIHILAGPTKPELAEKVTGEQYGKLLEFLRRMFPYIIVDTSSYLTEAVQAAMDLSDVIVLITTQDIPSIKNSNLFLSLADASGIHRERILFIMNRYDKRITISPEKVSGSLRQEIVLTIPLEEKIVCNSVNRGIPFVYENKSYPISKCFFALADLVKEKSIQRDEAKIDFVGRK